MNGDLAIPDELHRVADGLFITTDLKDWTAARALFVDGPIEVDMSSEFYGEYVWRHPVEADLDSTIRLANMEIYNYMQGPSEFTITGTLKSYDVTPLLKTIAVPTLYTVGDSTRPIRRRSGASHR